MRQLLLVAIISSLATSALAQSHDLPSPDASTVYAKHPGHVVAQNTGKTELQKEAERVSAYQQAMGNDKVQAPTGYSTPTPLLPQSVQAPLAPNGLQPMKLYETPASGAVHTVIKGDTLYNISKRYSVSLSELQRANQLPGSGIQLGQSLLIPVRQQASLNTSTSRLRKIIEPVPVEAKPDAETQLAAEPEQPKLQIYAVAPKDTLSAIARRTCVPTKQLIATNRLTNPDALRPGQRLTLPDGHCLTQ